MYVYVRNIKFIILYYWIEILRENCYSNRELGRNL